MLYKIIKPINHKIDIRNLSWYKVWDQTDDFVFNTIRLKLWAQVERQIKHQIRNQIEAYIEIQTFKPFKVAFPPK